MFFGCLTQNPMWRPLSIDKKSKTPKFQFMVIDLAEIVPQVTNSFPNYKDYVLVSCMPESDNAYIQLTGQDLIFKVSWNCQVLHEQSKTTLLSTISIIRLQS